LQLIRHESTPAAPLRAGVESHIFNTVGSGVAWKAVVAEVRGLMLQLMIAKWQIMAKSCICQVLCLLASSIWGYARIKNHPKLWTCSWQARSCNQISAPPIEILYMRSKEFYAT